MSNPIQDNLDQADTRQLPTAPGPQGVQPSASDNLRQQLEQQQAELSTNAFVPRPLAIEPQYDGPESVELGASASYDPARIAADAEQQMTQFADWMDYRNATAASQAAPVFNQNLNLPTLPQTPPERIVSPGDLGGLAAKRRSAQSQAGAGSLYYGPAGGPGGAGMVIPESMARYGPGIDSIIEQHRARSADPDPTRGVAGESVRGIRGLIGVAGRALLSLNRAGARGFQELRGGEGDLTKGDWAGGLVAGGLSLFNQEARKAWREGWKEGMTNLSGAEREALLQLTPTTQTGRQGFGDYGSHAIGAINYGLDFLGNQVRAQLAARKEVGVSGFGLPDDPALKAKLLEASRRNAQAALKGKEFSFLNPDSPISVFDKKEQNPTWWKTTGRTLTGIAADTVTDPVDLLTLGLKNILDGVVERSLRSVPNPPAPSQALKLLPPARTLTPSPSSAPNAPKLLPPGGGRSLDPSQVVPPSPTRTIPDTWTLPDGQVRMLPPAPAPGSRAIVPLKSPWNPPSNLRRFDSPGDYLNKVVPPSAGDPGVTLDLTNLNGKWIASGLVDPTSPRRPVPRIDPNEARRIALPTPGKISLARAADQTDIAKLYGNELWFGVDGPTKPSIGGGELPDAANNIVPIDRPDEFSDVRMPPPGPISGGATSEVVRTDGKLGRPGSTTLPGQPFIPGVGGETVFGKTSRWDDPLVDAVSNEILPFRNNTQAGQVDAPTPDVPSEAPRSPADAREALTGADTPEGGEELLRGLMDSDEPTPIPLTKERQEFLDYLDNGGAKYRMNDLGVNNAGEGVVYGRSRINPDVDTVVTSYPDPNYPGSSTLDFSVLPGGGQAYIDAGDGLSYVDEMDVRPLTRGESVRAGRAAMRDFDAVLKQVDDGTTFLVGANSRNPRAGSMYVKLGMMDMTIYQPLLRRYALDGAAYTAQKVDGVLRPVPIAYTGPGGRKLVGWDEIADYAGLNFTADLEEVHALKKLDDSVTPGTNFYDGQTLYHPTSLWEVDSLRENGVDFSLLKSTDYGPGLYLGRTQSVASLQKGSAVVPMQVDVRNPLRITDEQFPGVLVALGADPTNPDVMSTVPKLLQDAGYDALEITDRQALILFREDQVRSIGGQTPTRVTTPPSPELDDYEFTQPVQRLIDEEVPVDDDPLRRGQEWREGRLNQEVNQALEGYEPASQPTRLTLVDELVNEVPEELQDLTLEELFKRADAIDTNYDDDLSNLIDLNKVREARKAADDIVGDQLTQYTQGLTLRQLRSRGGLSVVPDGGYPGGKLIQGNFPQKPLAEVVDFPTTGDTTPPIPDRDAFVDAVRNDPVAAKADPEAPSKAIQHGLESGHLTPVKGGVVRTAEVIRSSQYKLIDLRIKQRNLLEQAKGANALLSDQLRNEAEAIQDLIDELRTTISGRPVARGRFTLTPTEIDDLAPTIPMEVTAPTPVSESVAQTLESIKDPSNSLAKDMVPISGDEPVSRTADELTLLAKAMGHYDGSKVLSWGELNNLKQQYGPMYDAMGPALDLDALGRTAQSSTRRVQVRGKSLSQPSVELVYDAPPIPDGPMVKPYQKAVAILKGSEVGPNTLHKVALDRTITDDEFVSLIKQWVASDGKGELRRSLNKLVPNYRPTPDQHAKLLDLYGSLKAKDKSKLPKGLRDMLSPKVETKLRDVDAPPTVYDDVQRILNEPGFDELDATESVPPQLEEAVVDDPTAAAEYISAERKAETKRESIVQQAEELAKLTEAHETARRELNAVPVLEPQSLLDGSYENGTTQDLVVELFESRFDYGELDPDLYADAPTMLDGIAVPAPTDAMWEGRWNSGGYLSEVGHTRGAVPPGWSMATIHEDVAKYMAQATVPANTIQTGTSVAPSLRKVSLKPDSVVVPVSAPVPGPMRAHLLMRAQDSGLPREVLEEMTKRLNDETTTFGEVLHLYEEAHAARLPDTPIDEYLAAKWSTDLYHGLSPVLDAIDMGDGTILASTAHKTPLVVERLPGITPVEVPPVPTKLPPDHPTLVELRKNAELAQGLHEEFMRVQDNLSVEQRQAWDARLSDLGIYTGTLSIWSRLHDLANALEEGRYMSGADTGIDYVLSAAMSQDSGSVLDSFRDAYKLYVPNRQQLTTWSDDLLVARDDAYDSAFVETLLSYAASVNPKLTKSKAAPSVKLEAPSPVQAAQARLAVDEHLLGLQHTGGGIQNTLDTYRVSNIERFLTEAKQTTTDTLTRLGDEHDESIRQLDELTVELEQKAEQTRKAMMERRAEQTQRRIDVEVDDIDELSDPGCL